MEKLIKFAEDFETLWNHFDQSIFSNEEVDKIIGNLVFKSIEKENYNNIDNIFGVYIFNIKPHKVFDFDSLKDFWTEESYRNYPKVPKILFETYKNIDTQNKYPFYLGKAENLRKRIEEHIQHRDKKSTYSLKLNGRTNFNSENISFAVWYLPNELKRHPKPIKQFIITELEKKLRNKLNPWIGKQ
jgi:predicted GIY-YIG superfamily endonuclease